jgi:hypothetical protein
MFMEIQALFHDKGIKPKDKTETISKWLLHKTLTVDELIEFAQRAKDPVKATCIEAIELATRTHPELATTSCVAFVSHALQEKAPRVKWESARVIGNIAHLHSNTLEEAIRQLLINAEHTGTVVRWSTAYALSRIVRLNTSQSTALIPVLQSIHAREENKSIKRMYADAIRDAT